jgi:Uma2 family endonuclease
MSIAAPRRRHAFREYLEVEELSPGLKHEFVNGEIFAMAGGSVEHAALSSAMGYVLTRRLASGPCRAYSADLRLRIPAANVATYADASVVRDPVERDPSSPTHVTNPRVVVEVLSPGTEDYDREEKRLAYQTLESLREYVLVAQDRRRIEVWVRSDEGWTSSTHDAGDTVRLPSIDLTFDVDELYAIAGISEP